MRGSILARPGGVNGGAHGVGFRGRAAAAYAARPARTGRLLK
jgi:hypothetical protein